MTSNRPPWRGDYHTDVNLQMNYWFVDQANLSDCFRPFAEWIHAIRDVWKERTKSTFKTRGWVMNPSNGIFGGRTSWTNVEAVMPPGCAQNLWDHYAIYARQGVSAQHGPTRS